MSSSVRQIPLLVLPVLAVVALASWPLPVGLEDFVFSRTSGAADASCTVWHSWSVLQSLLDGRSPFHAASLYHPHGLDTTLYTWNLGVPLLRVPFYCVAHPMRALALADLTIGLLNGLGGYVLGRVVGGRFSAGVAGALLAASTPFAWEELAAGRGEQGLLLFLLLSVAGLLALLRGGGRRVAVATGAAFAATAICYWFYGYFLVLASAGIVGWALVRRRLDRAAAIHLGVAGGVALTLSLPATLPVLGALASEDSVYTRVVVDTAGQYAPVESLSLKSLAWPLDQERTIAQYNRTSLLLKLLAVAGLAIPAVRRRSGWLVGLCVASLVFAMGPVLLIELGRPVLVGERALALPYTVLSWLPGMERLWWAVRWLALAHVAAVGIAAAAVAAMPGGRSRFALLAVLALLGVAECQAIGGYATELRYRAQPFELPHAVEVLGREPGRHPLLQFPFRAMGHLRWVPYHGQHVDGGLGDGREAMMPPWYAAQLEEEPVLAALSALSQGEAVEAWPPEPEAALCGLGYRYLFHWTAIRREVVGPVDLQELMQRPPDHEETDLRVWRLRPCAADAPL